MTTTITELLVMPTAADGTTEVTQGDGTSFDPPRTFGWYSDACMAARAAGLDYVGPITHTDGRRADWWTAGPTSLDRA